MILEGSLLHPVSVVIFPRMLLALHHNRFRLSDTCALAIPSQFIAENEHKRHQNAPPQLLPALFMKQGGHKSGRC